MVRDGIQAEHVGGQGDMAADALGHDPATGKTWLAQAKHHGLGNPVRSPDIQMVAGTASGIHGADVAVVVTNRSFTRDARQVATALGIHLIDRALLVRWASEGASLHQVLGIPPGQANSRRFTA